MSSSKKSLGATLLIGAVVVFSLLPGLGLLGSKRPPLSDGKQKAAEPPKEPMGFVKDMTPPGSMFVADYYETQQRWKQ